MDKSEYHRPGVDAFISHCSADLASADKVRRALRGMNVWLDRSDIVPGRLLRGELQSAIERSRALVLVWSKRAAKSRWVAAEILTAFHSNCAIVTCAIDNSELPYFLQNMLYLDLRTSKKDWHEGLRRGVRDAPAAAEQAAKAIPYEPPAAQKAINGLATRQRQMLASLDGDVARTRKRQQRMDPLARAAAKRWPLNAQILNLLGYHYKNAYMLKHWAAVQADQPPRDALLEKSERYFFRTLFVNPNDISALNGIGNVLYFARDFEAAEFFIRRAIALGEREGLDYSDAQHDLRLVLAHRAAEGTTTLGSSTRRAQ